LAVAPVGSVLPAAAVGADLDAVEDLAAVGAAGAAGAGFAAGAGAGGAGVAAAAAGAGADAAAAGVAFCIPPCPLQVPLPVDVLVVPSLHVVGAGSAAMVGIANASISKGVATRAATVVFFMIVHALIWFDCRRIVNRFLKKAMGAQCAGSGARSGNMPFT